MESFIKKVKKRNIKAGGEDQPAQETENHSSLDYNSSFRDEEELVDYEPESPPRMSAGEDELYSDYDQIPAHGDGPAGNTPTTIDFPAFLADDSNVPGRRRWQNLFREGLVSGASESGAPEPWFTIGKLSSIVDHAIIQWRDVCHVVPFHPMPYWAVPSCSGVMFVMLSHSIPCHAGPCHHAV